MPPPLPRIGSLVFGPGMACVYGVWYSQIYTQGAGTGTGYRYRILGKAGGCAASYRIPALYRVPGGTRVPVSVRNIEYSSGRHSTGYPVPGTR